MPQNSSFRIAVMPGDGIGTEIMPPCLEILRRVQARIGGFRLDFEELPAGADHYRETGTALPEDSLRRAGEADAVLLGAMGLPSVRYPDGREIAPQLDLRETFELFAGLRPVRSLPGLPGPLADTRARDLDFVLIRESTEGLFAARGKTVFDGDEVARDTMVITRRASERLFQVAFDLGRRRRAKGRPGRVTCVDKSNVLGSFGFFRKIFDEVAARNPDVEATHCYVDAMALTLIRNPWFMPWKGSAAPSKTIGPSPVPAQMSPSRSTTRSYASRSSLSGPASNRPRNHTGCPIRRSRRRSPRPPDSRVASGPRRTCSRPRSHLDPSSRSRSTAFIGRSPRRDSQTTGS